MEEERIHEEQIVLQLMEKGSGVLLNENTK